MFEIWYRVKLFLMSTAKSKISVIVITGNEVNNIADCLESVKWADEIIVVDSESKDATVELARKYTDKVIIKKWQGFSKQKAFALEQASNEWVLSIDADERVSEKLKHEILNLDYDDTVGYRIPRENYFLGKHITTCGWGQDKQLRLFIKSKTVVSDKSVHEGFIIDGKRGDLINPLIHHTHVSIQKTMEKVNSYSSLEAFDLSNKKKSGGTAIVLHALAAFLRSYFSLKGYKDGIHGLIISLFNSVTTMLKYMKIWEIQKSSANDDQLTK